MFHENSVYLVDRLYIEEYKDWTTIKHAYNRLITERRR